MPKTKTKTGETTFDNIFIEEVIKKYSAYIKKRCSYVSSQQIVDPIWGYLDLEQEIYLQIWRFSTKASQKFSTDKKIWIPQIEMIIRNVISNLLRRKSQRSDLFINYLQSHDEKEWAKVSLNDLSYKYIDLANYLVHVKDMVKPEYKKYFDEIVNPSDEFRKFIIENTPNGRAIKITKRIVSKYFKIAYNTAMAIFKDLEKTFEYCNRIA